jgi:hypothetical protein
MLLSKFPPNCSLLQIEDTWTLIDQEQEFESAMSGLNDMQLGRSLLGDELTDGNGNSEGSVDSGGLISQRQLDSIQLGESLADSTYSSNMSHSHSTVKSTYMQDVESEISAALTQERNELHQEIASLTGEMAIIRGEYFALMQEKQSLEADDAEQSSMNSMLKLQISTLMTQVSSQQTAIDREHAALETERAKHAATQKTLATVRSDIRKQDETVEAERASFASEREAFCWEKSRMEEEINELRKERQYWQAKCMESVEGTRDNEEILLASINSIKRRVLNLGNEARHCRLAEEEGGRLVSYPETASSSIDESVDSILHGNVHTGVEDIEGALCQLENEFIPIVSRWHSQSAVSSERGAPSRAPKISLSSFEENDLALFFPTPRGDYLAFNAGAPHHYLSAESKALIGQDKHFRKIYVLGKIVFKEEKIATAEDSPYRLAPGVKFYEVSVTSITGQIGAAEGGMVRVVEE